MKKIMIALAIMGIACSSAEAQSKQTPCSLAAKKAKAKKVAHVKRTPLHNGMAVKTYQVCRDEGGYSTCCIYKNGVAYKNAVAKQ
ncbi:MAG: hypothetical protein V4649_05635 [Bacteroidota bacterium]